MRRLLIAVLLFVMLAPAPALARIPHFSRRHNRHIIRVAAHKAHYGPKQTAALVWIATKESGLRNWALSRSDCHGLFQLSAGMAHGHRWRDPSWNAWRGVRYIKGRYGTPMRAKAFWLAHHWY